MKNVGLANKRGDIRREKREKKNFSDHPSLIPGVEGKKM